MHCDTPFKPWIYAGLFLISLATLMYEILLTRIFSVTMWYHFAFMAISIAMFGMTVGAVIVYCLPALFTERRTACHLAISSGLFSISIVICFLIYLAIPFTTSGLTATLFSRFGMLTAIYLIVSVPFVFSGISVCLALTRFPRQVSTLYAADLVGAALGCIVLVLTLNIVTGPMAVAVVASLAGVGTVLFACATDRRWIRIASVLCCGALILFTCFNGMRATRGKQMLKLRWVKSKRESGILYERWNSFSRITVRGNPRVRVRPFGWGLSPVHQPGKTVRQLWVFIDATAGTPLTAFSGNPHEVEFLKYDIVNLAHYIRPRSRVLVVGPGGGRDILSALAFDQDSVTGVEINRNILDTLNKRFGNFTGHLDRDPRVRFINDEARSYIARSRESYDIIQVSLIDSWAATAAGAFVLTENSLYTVEAWDTFLKRLTPGGVLTFSRWYFKDRPGEVYRLASLATEALARMGVKDPRAHIVIVRRMGEFEKPDAPDGVGTILVSRQPFSGRDLATIREVADRMKFELVLSPNYALDPVFERIVNDASSKAFIKQFPINIAAPTDDSPFFFYMIRLKDMFNRRSWDQGKMSFNIAAVVVVWLLLLITIVLTLACIIAPLALTSAARPFRLTVPLIAYFGAIGLAFMLIEISQIQRLIIFLGHPTYSLSVLLFSLLIFSGIGSLLTNRITPGEALDSAPRRLASLMLLLVIFGIVSPRFTEALQGAHTFIRIACVVAMFAPLAIFMGMAFPLGMKAAASVRQGAITPLLWGVNGATSVVASVLALAVALSTSISTAFWLGLACYAVAFASLIWFRKKLATASPQS